MAPIFFKKSLIGYMKLLFPDLFITILGWANVGVDIGHIYCFIKSWKLFYINIQRSHFDVFYFHVFVIF
jgi:hypothetical protein